MDNALVARLSHGAALDEADRTRLRALSSDPALVPGRTELARQGDRPQHVHVVLDGVACRTRLTSEGRRAILGLVLPGDVCGLHAFVLRRMDHAISTLSACRVLRVPAAAIGEVMAASPRVARALWWSTLVDESVSREWLVGAGQRRADQRMAHLFCELHARLRVVGRADGTSFALPLTQEELGEALGLSTVHAHRARQALRGAGLVVARGGTITIPNLAALQGFAGFEPDYLHLDERRLEEVG